MIPKDQKEKISRKKFEDPPKTENIDNSTKD